MSIISKITPERGEMAIRDRFTFSDAGEFRKILFGMMDANVPTINIDLSALNFSDSAGLGMLMVALKECSDKNIALTLSHPRGDVKALLELTKSYERFKIIG